MSGTDALSGIQHDLVVQTRPAFGDQAFGILAGGGKPRADEKLRHGDAIGHLCGAQGQGRQIVADAALFKDFAGGCLGGNRRVNTVQQSCDFIGQTDLGAVDVGTLQGAQPVAFRQRQFGVKFQEPPDIGVGGVAPVLPELVGRIHFGVQPDRTALRFAHLLAVRRGQKMRGQAVNLMVDHPARQVHAIDDIAPLIRATHLDQTAIAAV